MNAFLDDLKDWTDFDSAAVALGRNLGVFPPQTTLTDVKGMLWTNSRVGNTLYGMLASLCQLGFLDVGPDGRTYRAARPTLHPLEGQDDVPSLADGPDAHAQIAMSVDPQGGFWLEADRAGYRYLARVFEEIADSGLSNGWHVHRDAHFQASAGPPEFSFGLIGPETEEDEE